MNLIATFPKINGKSQQYIPNQTFLNLELSYVSPNTSMRSQLLLLIASRCLFDQQPIDLVLSHAMTQLATATRRV